MNLKEYCELVDEDMTFIDGVAYIGGVSDSYKVTDFENGLCFVDNKVMSYKELHIRLLEDGYQQFSCPNGHHDVETLTHIYNQIKRMKKDKLEDSEIVSDDIVYKETIK